MGRTLTEDLAKLSAARREKIERRAAELIAEEMSLRELRRALGRTQTKVAKALGIGQEAVSRLESRTDMLISTLDRYIKEAGGELEIIARFPNRRPVKLKGLGEIAALPKPRARTRSRHSERPAP
jgi:transcriptional regulator with XRE-family HTH domain